MEDMNRAEKAVMLRSSGYNCCQAVACVFAEEVGMDVETMYKVSEGFGGGMGTTLGVCGAVSGAAMICGMKDSNGDLEHPGTTKAKSMRDAGTIQRMFVDEAKALICREIKTGNDGAPYTSCPDCLRIAVRATEEVLGL